MTDPTNDSITSISISMRADGKPRFLLVLNASGQMKRMGYRALGRVEETIAVGEADGVFEDFMSTVPEGLLSRAGSYEDPGTEGPRCQWRIDFDSELGPRRFDITYCAASAGLPAAIDKLVGRAESLTDEWYRSEVEAATAEVDDVARQMAGATAPGSAPGGPVPPAAGMPPVTGLPPAQTLPPPSVWADGGIRNYLSFEGRIGRMDYLMNYCVPLAALGFAGAFADAFVGIGGDGLGPMGALSSLLTIWPAMAGFAKRLHDLDLSLWVFPGAMVGMMLMIGVGVVVGGPLALIPLVVSVLAMMALSIAVYLWPGTKGPNKYGPDPVALPG